MGWGLLPPPGDAAVAAEEAAAAAAAWMLMYLVAVDEAAVFGTTNAALAGVEVVNCCFLPWTRASCNLLPLGEAVAAEADAGLKIWMVLEAVVGLASVICLAPPFEVEIWTGIRRPPSPDAAKITLLSPLPAAVTAVTACLWSNSLGLTGCWGRSGRKNLLPPPLLPPLATTAVAVRQPLLDGAADATTAVLVVLVGAAAATMTC